MGLSIEKRLARRYIYCALPFVSWQFLNTTPSVKHVCVCVVLELECIYALLQTGAIVTFPNECWLQLSIQNIMVWYSSVLYIVVFSYFDAFKPIDSLYDNTSSAFNSTVHKFPFQTGVSVLFIIFEVNIVKCMEFNDWHHNIMTCLKIARTMKLQCRAWLLPNESSTYPVLWTFTKKHLVVITIYRNTILLKSLM